MSIERADRVAIMFPHLVRLSASSTLSRLRARDVLSVFALVVGICGCDEDGSNTSTIEPELIQLENELPPTEEETSPPSATEQEEGSADASEDATGEDRPRQPKEVSPDAPPTAATAPTAAPGATKPTTKAPRRCTDEREDCVAPSGPFKGMIQRK